MNIHKNARLRPHGRARLVALVAEGLSRAATAERLGVSIRTVGKWLTRFDAEQRRDLLEIVEDRYEARSVIVTGQLPVDRWY